MIDWETFKTQLQSDPGRMLKSVLLLAGCLFMIWLIVVMQSNPGMQQNVQVQGSGRLDSLRIAKMQSGDSPVTAEAERARPNRMPAEALPARDNSFSGLFPTVLIFLVMIGGAWYWLRNQKNSGTKGRAGALFTTITSQQLPGGPKLTVVKLNGEYWVMASGGPQGTELLHRYASEEWQGIEEIEKKQGQRDWKNTFLKTLQTSSASSDNAKQKRTG